MNFRVGQMVACIKDVQKKINERGLFEASPCKGMVYTVRSIRFFAEFQATGILLEEIVNRPNPWHDEMVELHFPIVAFRPVRETSIECFTGMLGKVGDDGERDPRHAPPGPQEGIRKEEA